MADGSSTLPNKETVTLRLPSGEMVDAIVPAGFSDADVKAYVRMKRPDLYGAPTSASNMPGGPKSQPTPKEVGLLTGKPSLFQGELDKPGMPGVAEGAGLAGGLAEYGNQSVGNMARGAGDVLQGNVSRGLHQMVGGAGAAMTPLLPLVVPGMLASPLATGMSIGGGIAGGKLATSGAQALGATPDQTQLAGDIGNLAGGYAGSKLNNLARAVASRGLLFGKTPAEAYQSALKPPPSTKALNLQRAVTAGLQEGIPVSKAGIDKLSGLLEDLQGKVSDVIQSDASRPISPGKVLSNLGEVRQKFANQVNPQADLRDINQAGKEFVNQFKVFQGPGAPPLMRNMTAEEAQAMKQGTYRVLGNKSYGELKGAQIEAQKALARGLKNELANAFPELNNLNARETRLYDLQDVLERAVKRIDNHQLMGIGTPLTTAGTRAVTGSNKMAAAAGIVKAVLDNPNVKSRLAIALAKQVPAGVLDARIRGLLSGLAVAASGPQAGGDQRTPQ